MSVSSNACRIWTSKLTKAQKVMRNRREISERTSSNRENLSRFTHRLPQFGMTLPRVRRRSKIIPTKTRGSKICRKKGLPIERGESSFRNEGKRPRKGITLTMTRRTHEVRTTRRLPTRSSRRMTPSIQSKYIHWEWMARSWSISSLANKDLSTKTKWGTQRPESWTLRTKALI